MTRQELVPPWRGALASLRARVSARRLVRLTLAVTALSFLALATEAVMRGRLSSPAARMPTAFYTRPRPWGGTGERRAPLPIGTPNGAALELRIPVRLGELPDHLVAAVLAVEDQRFYGHHGVDVYRIGGALLANLRAGEITQGGSTVTQQLAKNLFLSAGRSPVRKLREAALALALEARYSKARILEAYLNEIYLGQDGGRAIHGVGAAARYYFGKEARGLGLAESALLAGMIRAPNRTAPTRNPESARQRRDLVLRLMLQQQRISRTAAARALRVGIPTRAYPAQVVDGRYFRDFAARQVDFRLPARGVAIYTTLDATLQRAAERAVRYGVGRLRAPGVEAALVAFDPRTGEVLALVGGRDYGSSQFNRAVDARRQPGSAFKPVVAIAALERSGGHEPAFTLASTIEDEPLSVRTPSGLWQPTNYDRQFRGSVTVREAMEQSLNVPFARIGLSVGPERIAATAKRLGITSPLHAVPSLALGSSEVTLLELVRAYGVLAAGGDLATPRSLIGQARYGDPVTETGQVQVTRVVEPAVAYLVTSTLEGVVTRGTGRALNGDGRFEAIAGKTGTSNDWRDAWFIAYSPSLVVGAWVGFDDGRSLGMSGASAALPVVARFLEAATGEVEREQFEVPDGITEGYVALAQGGWLPTCGSREFFLAGTEPSGSGCFKFEIPSWEWRGEWHDELKRRASRFLQELAEGLEELRARR
ncbi:MAG TPA: transglycosylase domain-containing protein [Gemmatimonadales bacterium]|jgi:penicillin-binding protein 1B|nr:transglycosylase domain-containing protein [Gemmatimonadales bacterium]